MTEADPELLAEAMASMADDARAILAQPEVERDDEGIGKLARGIVDTAQAHGYTLKCLTCDEEPGEELDASELTCDKCAEEGME